MKKLFKLSLLFILLAFTVTSCSEGKLKDGTYSFDVYATNDLHGRFFDSLYVNKNSYETHEYSLASVATTMKEARANSTDANIILLDIGDHLQGDNAAFYYNFIDTTSTHIFSRIMNYLDYDAVVVGNHDIEPGKNVYDKVTKEMDMPYLAANAIDTKTGKPYFDAYTILNRNGVKIAVIGLTNPNIPNWLSPHLWEGIEFEEVVPTLEHWVEYVREKEQPHFVIAAMHAGLGDKESDSKENPSRFVAKNVKGIDLVLAAHDHQVVAEKFMNGDKEIWVLEGGSRASTLSKANVQLTVKDGKVVSTIVAGESISMSDVKPDATYLEQFRDDFLKVKEFTNRPVGELNNDIASRDAYFGSSAYIDMIHTLQLKASGADISFAAPLSFNATIEKGELNYQNLLDIYPFENQLYVIEMTGQEIKDYLEFSYASWLNPDPMQNGHLLDIKLNDKRNRWSFSHPSYNFDSAAGIQYEVDVTKKEGDRINIISLADGSAYNMDDKYKVAMTSYRASGGGYHLEQGAGISKDEMDSRLVARLADIRELLYDQILADGSIEAEKLNQWKFVPQSVVGKLAEKDYQLLFN
ncbi:MAG: bifunctional metallophosphatase/5'-nucleotidase [Bacteroidales bacterium]|jgi:2',3'-cyclic-nucleotide 2'-phosphodiesterase/3'-nucleotidase|nr:bifunctional metallophosphatase/5'-nucleotidase [Bacteroidales bacterium]